jgi:metal-responsive CopG/Arc/MetJ family transcriptional regulator
MKIAISIPDPISEAVDRLAKRQGKSRSQVYAEAVAEYIRDRRDDSVTERLNSVYLEASSSLDPVLERTQTDQLSGEDW